MKDWAYQKYTLFLSSFSGPACASASARLWILANNFSGAFTVSDNRWIQRGFPSQHAVNQTPDFISSLLGWIFFNRLVFIDSSSTGLTILRFQGVNGIKNHPREYMSHLCQPTLGQYEVVYLIALFWNEEFLCSSIYNTLKDPAHLQINLKWNKYLKTKKVKAKNQSSPSTCCRDSLWDWHISNGFFISLLKINNLFFT